MDDLIFMLLLIMVGPAALLFIIGAIVRKSNKKAAKVLFILGVIYLVVSFGTCSLAF